MHECSDMKIQESKNIEIHEPRDPKIQGSVDPGM